MAVSTAGKWYADKQQLQSALDRHGSWEAVARATGVAATTLKSAASRAGITASKADAPGVVVNSDDAIITLPPGVELGELRDMISHHGLNPDEWLVTNVSLNKWDGQTADGIETFRQVKASLRKLPRMVALFPAGDVRERKPVTIKRTKRPELWVFTSCWQAPYHDEAFHRAFCGWLAENKPDHGVDLGDLMDLPTVSKHRDNPAYFASVQECVNTGFRLLSERHDASPSTRWRLLEGNHDERLRTELLSRSERMYGIRPATLPGDPPLDQVLSLRRLLHLDRLGVEFIATPDGGNYEHAEVQVAETLVARHGWITGPNAAARTVEKVGRSVIVGHTHMQGIQPVPRYYRGQLETLIGVEVGCGCEVKPDGLGYAAQPRWVQGFATASVWPDGEFTIDLARFENGVLRWRDLRVAA